MQHELITNVYHLYNTWMHSSLYKCVKYGVKGDGLLEVASTFRPSLLDTHARKLKAMHMARRMSGGADAITYTPDMPMLLSAFHGTLLPDEEFVVPDNVTLILPYCCGFMNTLTVDEHAFFADINSTQTLADTLNGLTTTRLLTMPNGRNIGKMMSFSIPGVEKKLVVCPPGTRLCNVMLVPIMQDVRQLEGIFTLDEQRIISQGIFLHQRLANPVLQSHLDEKVDPGKIDEYNELIAAFNHYASKHFGKEQKDVVDFRESPEPDVMMIYNELLQTVPSNLLDRMVTAVKREVIAILSQKTVTLMPESAGKLATDIDMSIFLGDLLDAGKVSDDIKRLYSRDNILAIIKTVELSVKSIADLPNDTAHGIPYITPSGTKDWLFIKHEFGAIAPIIVPLVMADYGLHRFKHANAKERAFLTDCMTTKDFSLRRLCASMGRAHKGEHVVLFNVSCQSTEGLKDTCEMANCFAHLKRAAHSSGPANRDARLVYDAMDIYKLLDAAKKTLKRLVISRIESMMPMGASSTLPKQNFYLIFRAQLVNVFVDMFKQYEVLVMANHAERYMRLLYEVLPGLIGRSLEAVQAVEPSYLHVLATIKLRDVYGLLDGTESSDMAIIRLLIEDYEAFMSIIDDYLKSEHAPMVDHLHSIMMALRPSSTAASIKILMVLLNLAFTRLANKHPEIKGDLDEVLGPMVPVR